MPFVENTFTHLTKIRDTIDFYFMGISMQNKNEYVTKVDLRTNLSIALTRTVFE